MQILSNFVDQSIIFFSKLLSSFSHLRQCKVLNANNRYNFHLFQMPDGKAFLFEAGSGLFFELSDLGYAFIRLLLLPDEQVQEEAKSVAKKFPVSDITACANEADKVLTILHRCTLPPPPKQRPIPSPFTLSLHTSLKCNLACPYCFASSARKRAWSQTMSQAIAQRALDWFADFLVERGILWGVIGFNLAAEPMLSWDMLLIVDDYRKHIQRT